MELSPHSARLQRLQERLNNSKYWSLSLAIHAVVITALSTLVLVKNSPSEDFPMEGDIPSEIEVKLPPPSLAGEEKPRTEIPDAKPADQKSSFADAVGKATTSDIPVITVALPTRITVPPFTDSFDDPEGLKQPLTVPKEMGDRFRKDASNRIMLSGRPSLPRPTDETENAVLRGLNWLRDNQNEDGFWGDKNKGAMTGLALLCFLGHGETGESKYYGYHVNKAIQWVLDQGTAHQGRLSMTADGWGSGNGGVYEHAILTYALGEYFTMTQDQRVTELLKQAVGYIVQGQGPDGGWMYRYDKSQGDTSVTGWQVQALKAAHLTKLNLPGVDAALDRAMKHFERVQGPNGGYGYRTAGDRYSLSGVGVLSELFWTGKRDSDLRDGVKFILDQSEKEYPVAYDHEKGDLYAWYYHTQALLMFGGGTWEKWEQKFRPMAVKSQSADGSWPMMKAPGHGNLQNDPGKTGTVYRTTLCVLMLESYYRYLPLNQANHPSDGMRMASR